MLGLWFVGLSRSKKDFTELVRAAVNPQKADFAIVTGIQIHSYGKGAHNEATELGMKPPKCL